MPVEKIALEQMPESKKPSPTTLLPEFDSIMKSIAKRETGCFRVTLKDGATKLKYQIQSFRKQVARALKKNRREGIVRVVGGKAYLILK